METRGTAASPCGIPGLCNHQFSYPIQFWSHCFHPLSRPPYFLHISISVTLFGASSFPHFIFLVFLSPSGSRFICFTLFLGFTHARFPCPLRGLIFFERVSLVCRKFPRCSVSSMSWHF